MVNITAESVSRIANLSIKSVESNSRMSNFLGTDSKSVYGIIRELMEVQTSKSVGREYQSGIKSKSGPRVTQCGRISL